MPSPNTRRTDIPNTYYHVYARGIDKQQIFLDEADCEYFIGLLRRYLSATPTPNKDGGYYESFFHRSELLAYCLMGNHFHLLFYQIEQGSMTALMRSIMVSYSRYFNLRYKRRGTLFESRFKASAVLDDTYLMHISRYIHLNPRYWKRYPYSSLRQYLVPDKSIDWLRTDRILPLFNDRQDYFDFHASYIPHRDMLQKIKENLSGY